jgi:precorrin-3B C17-methyltransferase
MAGLALDLLAKVGRRDGIPNPIPRVEVIPGITAANAAAALLGAPLMLDYAIVSLSDALIPWETIETRLMAAVAGDFVLVLYNPASERRLEPLRRAHEILLAHRPIDTPVGVVREAYRPQQSVRIVELERLLDSHIDMKTVLIVGNSTTKQLDKWMVTPRGYCDGVGARQT